MFDTENPTDVGDNPGQPSTADDGASVQQTEIDSSADESVDNSFMARARAAMQGTDREEISDDDPEPPPASDETGEEPAETGAEEEEPKDEKDKPARVSNYQQLKQETETLRTEREQIEKDLAVVGGREGLSYISNLLGAFSSPNEKFELAETDPEGNAVLDKDGNPVTREITGKDLIYEFVNQTPEADGIFSDFFLRGLENEANRVFAVNDVLKQEFALRPDIDLSPEQLNSVFGYLAAQLNTAKTPEEIKQVFDEFDFKAKGLDYDPEEFSKDRKIAELEAKLAAKENPPAAQQEDPVTQVQKHYETVLADEKTRFEVEDNLLIERYSTASKEFFGSYGLAVTDTDGDEIKNAKELLNDLLLGRRNVASAVRFSPAFKQTAGYLHKGTLKSHLGSIAGNNLDSAMRAQVSLFLKTLSPILGSRAAPPPKSRTGENQNGDRAGIQPTGKQPETRRGFMSRTEQAIGRKIKQI